MTGVQHQQISPDSHRFQARRDELRERALSAVVEDGITQIVDGLTLFRLSHPHNLIHCMTQTILCVTLQGRKEMTVGQSCYVYNPSNYVLTTIELPSISRILDASKDRPYLSLIMELPVDIIRDVLLEADNITPSHTPPDLRAIDVSPLDADLVDALLRMIRLQETPEKIDMLLPMIQREIIYYLLLGSQAGRLSHLLASGEHMPYITRSIQWIRQNFDQPLHIEELAQECGMSTSSFHRHFKEVTSMSPLQFQKQLRLQTARHLMLNGEFDAAGAAYHVGYNDASHFGRDYKNYFGESPKRDIQRLRDEVSNNNTLQ